MVSERDLIKYLRLFYLEIYLFHNMLTGSGLRGEGKDFRREVVLFPHCSLIVFA
jgi:hypothetical protein